MKVKKGGSVSTKMGWMSKAMEIGTLRVSVGTMQSRLSRACGRVVEIKTRKVVWSHSMFNF